MSLSLRLLARALPLLLSGFGPIAAQQPAGAWPEHSIERPKPPVERAPAEQLPAAAPAPPGAIARFDGDDLSGGAKWDETPAGWRVADGNMEIVKGAGGIQTRIGFGDVRLHIEWAWPKPALGTAQDRGNSGVFVMGQYVVQVLDSYGNDTYADGQVAALFGQYPPRVNVSRPPGEWQSFDIEFRRPRFDSTGMVRDSARVTVWHNGVLVHANVTLLGSTSHLRRDPCKAHADQLPISLADELARRWAKNWADVKFCSEACRNTGGVRG